MKKNELVHLHGLLNGIAEWYIERDVAAPADFEGYRRLGVTPLSLRASRAEHERAVLTLVRLLGGLSSGAERDLRPPRT